MTLKVDIGQLESVSKSTNPDVNVLLGISRSMTSTVVLTDAGCANDDELAGLKAAASSLLETNRLAFEALSLAAHVLTQDFKGSASTYADAEGSSYRDFDRLRGSGGGSGRRQGGPMLDPDR